MNGGTEPSPFEAEPAAPQGGADAGAFAFEHLREELHRYLLRRLSRPHDVEDLAQEVYLRLLRFAQNAVVRSPRAYVLRVAFNVLAEFRYHGHRALVAFDSESADEAARHLADDGAQPDEIYDTRVREERVEGMLDRLTPMQRAVLTLSTRESQSHAQIAERLGISASTARVHLCRAIQTLREELGRE
jgi:RNA polymerase sigma factor (sigma-70 family)